MQPINTHADDDYMMLFRKIKKQIKKTGHPYFYGSNFFSPKNCLKGNTLRLEMCKNKGSLFIATTSPIKSQKIK